MSSSKADASVWGDDAVAEVPAAHDRVVIEARPPAPAGRWPATSFGVGRVDRGKLAGGSCPCNGPGQ
jgi:hypothetical protein